MVYEDKHNIVSQQGRPLQTKAWSLAFRELFPRLFRRQRCEPSSEIFAMAIQPSQPGAS